ncbi:thyroglobulin type-1 repeat-containing protein [Candidatus Coxiella mudrowiae]|uniref:Thyroglobulin type-1 repeat domain protein n=1 Tax=Candidatus Coxiella mudrowiae TaxID=2054173 RepID=A0ABN4HTG3_9COXI|nr:thyroglobulin type-1 repeat-containing protein [Candidatus Coxiella mudrowiae]AKQ33711.1 Thyroglobulin type-1 repeat domain protein [Candidatus Coxiella mudrowiae]
MRTIFYILILVILVFAFSVFIKRHDYTRKEDSCLHVRKTLLSKTPKPADIYIPQCTLFGDYISKQCNQSTSECWCVTLRGKEILNSRTPLGKTPDQCRLNWVYELYRRMQ